MPGPTLITHFRALRVLRWTWAVIRLGRPLFLVGGLVFFGLGAIMAHATGYSLSWPRYFAGQAVVTSVQLMTHYANDYFDFEADVANCSPTRWSGGSRVLPLRQVSRSVALYAAVTCVGCAVASMLVVHALGAGVNVWSLMLAMSLLAWSYSAPPMRLNSRGWGELVAAVVVAALVPFLGFAVQVGSVTTLALLAVLPLLLVQFVMLLVLDVPDRQGDATVGKSTLVVRLGVDSAALLHNVALLGAYALLPVLLEFGLPHTVAFSFACTAPLALFQVFAVARGRLHDSRRWEVLALCAVALVLVGTIAELVGFAVMSTQRSVDTTFPALPRSGIAMTRGICDARLLAASDTGGSHVFGGK